MKTFVITNPENGWDCVKGVYQAESEEKLKDYLLNIEQHSKEYVEEVIVITQKKIITV